MRIFSLLLGAALALTLPACTQSTPLDNAAGTSCAPGTPEEEASALCNDVTLSNGQTVVAPAEPNVSQP